MTSTEESIDLLPLVVKRPKYDKTRISSFRLLTDPADSDSVKYDFTMNQFDGSAGLRKMLTFVINVKKLAVGTNLISAATATNAATLITLTERMLHDSAQNPFIQGCSEHLAALHVERKRAAYHAHIRANATDANNPTAAENVAAMVAHDAVVMPVAVHATFTAGLQKMVATIAPFRALARVKRYLRRQCRKPADMSIRAYVSHFMRINEEELILLPPFLPTNKLDISEMIEIWQYAVPSSWNRKLQEQGKDPLTMTTSKLLETLEYIESSETDFEKVGSKKDKSSSSSNHNGKKKKKVTYNNDAGGDKYCKVHGNNKTHTSAECKVLKSQQGGEKKTFSKNKSWSRDANKGKESYKKDFHAYIAKAVKQELNSFAKGKKRKSELNAVETKNGSDDDTLSLGDIDVAQFENLSFAEDDDNESFGTAKEE